VVMFKFVSGRITNVYVIIPNLRQVRKPEVATLPPYDTSGRAGIKSSCWPSNCAEGPQRVNCDWVEPDSRSGYVGFPLIATEFCVAANFRDVPVIDTQVVNRNQPMLCRLGFSAPQDLLRLIASTAPV
jgi:hypothetical protein